MLRVATASEMPLAKTVCSLYHATLTGAILLFAIQLRLTVCPILSGGGDVANWINGISAVFNQRMASVTDESKRQK